jgi:ribosomal protein S18 acetylase RimI-like enzyme
MVLSYRTFRNTDPPLLVQVWNDSLTGRGAVQLMGTSPLEYQVFSKPYFDPAGLILAEDEGKVVGFAHAGLCPNEQESGLSPMTGVICVVAVRPSHRRQGIGTELVRRCEQYLLDRGGQLMFAGPRYPHNPFYFGLYGGSGLPGFLISDTLAEPFFQHLGYTACGTTLVFHRGLQDSMKLIDPRFMEFRQRFEIHAGAARARATWWQNAVLGMIEPMEFFLHDKSANVYVAEAMLGDMEGFSWRWNQPAIGINSFEVEAKHRRQGLGKFFLAQLLRYFQDQCFLVAEVQLDESNAPAIEMCQAVGFDQVDVGKVYRRELEQSKK